MLCATLIINIKPYEYSNTIFHIWTSNEMLSIVVGESKVFGCKNYQCDKIFVSGLDKPYAGSIRTWLRIFLKLQYSCTPLCEKGAKFWTKTFVRLFSWYSVHPSYQRVVCISIFPSITTPKSRLKNSRALYFREDYAAEDMSFGGEGDHK